MSIAQRMIRPTVNATFIHQLDARVKIFLLLATSVLVIFLDNPKSLLLLFVFVSAAALSARLPAKNLKILAVLVLLAVWGTMFSQALFYSKLPRTVLFVIIHPKWPVIGELTGGLFVYKQGFTYGAVQALRFASMLTLGLLLSWTTQPRDLLLGLIHFKVPYEVSFMTVTAVRFLPLVMNEVRTVLTVQRLRGYRPLKSSNWIKLIRTSLYTLKPILANCLRRAGTLAVSAESRGFRVNPEERTYWRGLEYSYMDRGVLWGGTVFLVGIVAVKVVYLLYFNGVYYTPFLRELYGLAKNWL